MLGWPTNAGCPTFGAVLSRLRWDTSNLNFPFLRLPQILGAPGLDFETWDTSNYGCPTFGAALSRLRWDTSNLYRPTSLDKQVFGETP